MDKQSYWDKVTEDTEIEWLRRHNLLSVRASNILTRGAIYRGGGEMDYHPIKTVKELLGIDECELTLYRNMGRKSLEEIEAFKEKFLEKSNVQKLHNSNNTITESEQNSWLDGYKVGFRDGVTALRIQAVEKIDEICKEISEGK